MMKPTPLTADNRQEIEACVLARDDPSVHPWLRVGDTDIRRLLAAEAYWRERAERLAAALSWYADRSNYQEFRVESGAILGALQDDEAWAIVEHEDHPGDPAGVARAVLVEEPPP